MKRKIRLLVLVTFSLLFIAGWGKKNVELLNDKKLIDLNVAIGLCMPGADALSSDINTDNDIESEDEESLTDTRDHIEDGERTIVISVRDQKVTYDSEWIDLDNLKDRIRQDCSDKVSFQLVDDFAETHVYQCVLTILADLKSEIGLKYMKE